jgi:hypothetical protein
MRFMMLMIPNVAPDDWTPSPEAIAAMGRYNQELNEAGVLLSLDGLHPTTDAARIKFAGAGTAPSVTDGPFTEAKEVIGGYWMVEVKSRDEAVEWARRCPAWEGDVIEVRQVQEISDFPEDAQAAAAVALDLP